MTSSHMSHHTRMALLERFAPVELLEDSTRESPRPGFGQEGRIHLWGEMNGAPVDVLVRWGGVLTAPSVTAASLEPVGSETISPGEIIAAAQAVLCRAG